MPSDLRKIESSGVQMGNEKLSHLWQSVTAAGWMHIEVDLPL